MNKNINNVVELTEKELVCVCGGMSGIELIRKEESMRRLGKSEKEIERAKKRYAELGCKYGGNLG